MKPPSEVLAYYERFPEESRLQVGAFRLEFERSKTILARVLPPPPARIVDVGGAAGAYSAWLAQQGYEVHLVDASARLVEHARTQNLTLTSPIATLTEGDARALPHPDGSAAAVLVMGPLYHLPSQPDRHAALREAFRVLAPSGLVVAAAISRYASTLDGLARKLAADPAFTEIRNRDLLDGQHRNETNCLDYFTTAYFHRPEDLQTELEATGFDDVAVLGVEGPAWMLPDFEAQWADPVLRQNMLDVAQALESEPSIVGASAHLLGIGRRPASR
ncbi:MAG TPA: class I SAM-dependent methyltransferase [Vicinamibacterales bacterium]